MPVSNQEKQGRLVRLVWIKGIQTYFPGKPKASYIAPWEEMNTWERAIVLSIYEQVRAFLLAGRLAEQSSSPLTREQGGRLVRLIWITQVHRLLPQPKDSYVQSWETTPTWEREIDNDIFAAIEQEVRDEQGS